MTVSLVDGLSRGQLRFSAEPAITLGISNDFKELIRIRRLCGFPHSTSCGRCRANEEGGVAAAPRVHSFAVARLAQGKTPTASSPRVSSQPIIAFMFWIACPEAPFTRLSMTHMTIARPGRRSSKTEM